MPSPVHIGSLACKTGQLSSSELQQLSDCNHWSAFSLCAAPHSPLLPATANNLYQYAQLSRLPMRPSPPPATTRFPRAHSLRARAASLPNRPPRGLPSHSRLLLTPTNRQTPLPRLPTAPARRLKAPPPVLMATRESSSPSSRRSSSRPMLLPRRRRLPRPLVPLRPPARLLTASRQS